MMTRVARAVFAIAICAAGSRVWSSSPTAAQDPPADPTLILTREDEFLRGLADLGLARALDDLDRVCPVANESDPAAERLRLIARARLDVRAPSSTIEQRQQALDRLRETRTALITALATDPRVPLWLGDAAEDDLVLGFFGLDGGGQAIAGSPVAGLASRVRAPLARIHEALAEAQRFDSKTPQPSGPALAQRLEDDRLGRRPLLAAIASALGLAIARDGIDATEAAERAQAGQKLLDAIETLRARAPHRLRIETDLGEAAAAAVTPDSERGRFAAARLALSGDAVAFTLGRILAIDALVTERRGPEALATLAPLVSAEGMPTALSILCADAFVRLRVTLGRSPATETTLNPWITTLRRASPQERESLRRAILERLGGVLRDAHLEAALPRIASIALARLRGLASDDDAASLATLRDHAKADGDPEALACALASIADVELARAHWAEAAEALASFARRLPQDPSAPQAMQGAIDLELALDATTDGEREVAFERTLTLALTNYPELPTRPRTAAQLAALAGRRAARDVADSTGSASAERAAALASHASQIRGLRDAAARVGLDGGPSVDAAASAVECAAALVGTPSSEPSTAPAPPTAAQWAAWPPSLAALVARLRLELLAQRTTSGADLATDIGAIPADLAPSLDTFVSRRVRASEAALLIGDGVASRTLAARALAMADVWDTTHPRAATGPANRTDQRLRARAALLGGEFARAVDEARRLLGSDDRMPDDQRLLVEGLMGALRESATATAGGDERTRVAIELMEEARILEAAAPKGSPNWWLAHAAQIEVATRTGRISESVRARIARLRAFDPSLGGAAFKASIESVDGTPAPPN